MNDKQLELAEKFGLDVFTVPAHLADFYKKQQVSRLEVLEGYANQDEWARELAYAECGYHFSGYAISERATTILKSYRPKLDNFIEHKIKLGRAREAYEAPIKAQEAKQAQEAFIADHTCPVCHGIEINNNRYGPCKQCVMVARFITANTAERNKAVGQWLKANEVDWLGM